MSEQKETIDIRQVHDNNKFIITRKIVEEVDGDQLLKIFEQIEKGLEEARKQLEDIPKQLEEREKFLRQQFETLKDRVEIFGHHARKLKDLSKPEEKNPLTSS